MALTRDDLQAIQQVVVETTMPMFEQVFERFDRLETRMDRAEKVQDEHTKILNEHTKILDEHTNRLQRLEEKTDSIDGRLQAVEADIKELYHIVADQKTPGKFAKLTAEQKVIKTYQDVLALAKELNITLPQS